MADNDVISIFLGPFGKFQLRSTLLIFLVKIPSAWFMACLIYTAKTPPAGEIFCKPPIDIPSNATSLWIKAAHKERYNRIEDEASYDFCNKYNNSLERYLTSSYDAPDYLLPCTEFSHILDRTYISIINQYELFCSRDALLALTQSFHLLGVLIGGIIANYMLKTISPRRTMLAGMISQIFLGIATGYAPTYLLHIFFRCAVAATCSLQCIGIMTLSDITSGKYRVAVVCLFEQFWSIGVILLPLASTWWSSWSIVYIAITLPTFILIFLYPWIPDSPRWLIKHGKVDEAMKVLLMAAKVNGKKDFKKDDLERELKSLAIQAENAPPEPSWWSIWDGGFTLKLKLFVAHIGWSVFLMLYFAYLLHVRAMGRVYLNINTVIAGISQIIGTFIGLHLILNTSKKWLWTSLLNIAASLVAFSANFVPDSIPHFERMVIYMATAMTATATVSTTLSIFITCTTEIVSKDKKRICNYSGVSTSRTLVMIAPFIGFCGKFGQLVPQNIMVAMNIAMSVLIMICIRTPRTIPKNRGYIPEEISAVNGKDVTRL
ncbi:organic cation transporter-like protein [Chironomus tepperi]|uniref:organic cation transporter-like protein n=1 Tax=Chironomus tepperi TaxID=113505 RepID=UPI00391FC252